MTNQRGNMLLCLLIAGIASVSLCAQTPKVNKKVSPITDVNQQTHANSLTTIDRASTESGGESREVKSALQASTSIASLNTVGVLSVFSQTGELLATMDQDGMVRIARDHKPEESIQALFYALEKQSADDRQLLLKEQIYVRQVLDNWGRTMTAYEGLKRENKILRQGLNDVVDILHGKGAKKK